MRMISVTVILTAILMSFWVEVNAGKQYLATSSMSLVKQHPWHQRTFTIWLVCSLPGLIPDI